MTKDKDSGNVALSRPVGAGESAGARTSGYWYYTDNFDGGYASEFSRWTVCTDDWTVAAVITDTPELAEAGEANARLIAAAPELLEALETIAAQGSGIVGSTARADCMAALAKLAIAKAKGVQP